MPQDPPDYFGLVLVALVNLMFNGEHLLSFKNGVKFFFLCVSFVVALLSCGAWHLGLTLYKLTRGPLMTVCLAFVFSGVILLSAQNQEVVKLCVQGAVLADCCEPGQGRLGHICFSLYMRGR